MTWLHSARKRLQARQADSSARHPGQSLAEFTLVLPVLLVIVAGVLEVSNVLNNYNTVTAAAREAARFGAAGGSDEGIVDVAAQALGYDSPAEANGRLEVWVVRPVANTDTNPWSWENDSTRSTWGDVTPVCAFPQVSGTPTCTLGGMPGSSSLTTIDRIQYNAPTTSAAYSEDVDGTRFVVVSVYYRINSILNLPFFRVDDGTGFVPLASQAIMRQEVEQSAISALEEGCSLYPIAFHSDSTETTGIRTFMDAREGDIFHVNRGLTGYDFVYWRDVTSASLDRSLNPATAPNSKDPTYGFVEVDASGSPVTPADTSVNINDWVLTGEPTPGSYINAGNVQGYLNGYMAEPARGNPPTLRVLLFNADQMTGLGVSQVQVSGFAIVRITDYEPGFTWLEAEFIRWDSTCGQDILGS